MYFLNKYPTQIILHLAFSKQTCRIHFSISLHNLYCQALEIQFFFFFFFKACYILEKREEWFGGQISEKEQGVTIFFLFFLN